MIGKQLPASNGPMRGHMPFQEADRYILCLLTSGRP